MLNMQPDVKKNERDFLNGGLTPLMVAVKHKHVEAVRKMVKLKVKYRYLHFPRLSTPCYMSWLYVQ